MKVEDLKKELTAKIKNLILEILKDFDLSRCKIKIKIFKIKEYKGKSYENQCNIYIIKDNLIYKIHYHNFNIISISIYSKKDLLITRYAYDIIYRDYKAYPLEEIIQFLDSEAVKIIRKLHKSKRTLRTKLKNILE
ncbi:hypothetical protein [Brachyspira alvinipulli]|uniref:hypothetical protein n=1 Tax=Brachyspira alvinipulli TaxID=84379 RepID=UPI00047F9B6A|nr:hypothetical protein [Brachyspira alvinipulli]